VKWSGTILSIVFAVVWIGSGWLFVRWMGRDWSCVDIHSGRFCVDFVRVGYSSQCPTPGWHAGRNEVPFQFWVDGVQTSDLLEIRVPMWPLVVLFALPAATACRLEVLDRRRYRSRWCPTCRHDCRGLLAGAACPECGASAPPAIVRRYPRIRKLVKWSGAVVSLVFAVAWIGSSWWSIGRMTNTGFSVIVQSACVEVADPGLSGVSLPAAQWAKGGPHFSLVWWFKWQTLGSGWDLVVPLWAPVLLAVLVTAAAWRRDAFAKRIERAGHCSKCGYDRRGLPTDSLCPECGATPPV